MMKVAPNSYPGVIRKVARMGNPVLRVPARELSEAEIGSPETKRLLADMIATMEEYGGIGLAAPQIHESVAVAIIRFDDSSARYPGMGEQPLTIFINPKITVTDAEEQGFWEGCLSVPDLKGLVHRPSGVRVEYRDQHGEKQVLEAHGFLATVIQHELDHLAGRLYVDLIRDSRNFAFAEEYQRFYSSS